ncbi:hypothetical protein ANCCEY_00108 [Ancylostoma ceylanicum]|uniref:O-methyltransferase n=1 Tax=Ancylostoma ceylanicum TaxID=53326 RepID=A0A0D6MC43_9BILA|nr:hypothetical protein ANCCEY_00108 [Ancylostoma ceylanicum]
MEKLSSPGPIMAEYANLERMFQAIREATLREGADDSDGSLGLTDLATVGRDFFSGISRFFSTKFDDEDRRIIANGIREFFNVTTPDSPMSEFLQARKFTRPPPTPDPTTATSSYEPPPSCNRCRSGKRCQLNLRSFDTTDSAFQYAYSHSSAINDYMQTILRETQMTAFSSSLSWRSSVTPELIQLAKSLISLYQPSRCLVIGVFTGLGLLGIAEEVEPRGLIIALEHPSLVQYWEEVGLKLTKMNGHAHTSRIQLKSSEPIEKALPKLAANEPNNFDFIFLDDFKRDNYLDDYEHSIRLLRRGGLLIINQALNNGGVLTDAELMTENDRVMSSMNVRIREDGRVRASLLPFAGGTWIILKK